LCDNDVASHLVRCLSATLSNFTLITQKRHLLLINSTLFVICFGRHSEALLTAFSGYACADTAMTNEHISMIRSVKFKSSEDQNTYLYQANMEVAKWQAVYSGIGVGEAE